MTTSRLRRAAAATGALAVLVVSTGCTAEVATTITVTGAQEASVRVAAEFTGEAAEALGEDRATLAELSGVFRDRTGTEPDIEEDAGSIRVAQVLTYDELTEVSDLVGVGAVRLSEDDGSVRLDVDLVPPSGLAHAVRSVTKAQPDAGPLAETMLESTEVSVAVIFPGGVETTSGADADVSGDTVVHTRTADSRAHDQLTVTGDPTSERWMYVSGAVAAFAVLGWLLRRRLVA